MTSRIDKLLREVTGAPSLASAHALRERPLVVTVSERTSAFMLQSAVALAMRSFTAEIVVRAVGNKRIASRLVDAAEAEAEAYGSVDRLRFAGAARGTPLGLACAIDGIHVDAAGMTVAVNRLLSGGQPTAPAAAFAVAGGMAKIFAALVGRTNDVVLESWSGTLLDFTPSEATVFAAPLEIGAILVIGGGAIGSALAHVLHGCGWSADLCIVDPQRYDEPNHETTLLVSKRDTLRQAKKAETLASLARRDGLSALGIEDTIGMNHHLLGERFDVLACCVDNAPTRRVLDHTASRLVLNGAVGGQREDAGHVLWSRHGPAEPPLSALYPERSEEADVSVDDVPEEAQSDACSRVAYASVALAAPFMGLAAGALLAAGIAQHALGGDRPTNYVKFDMLGLQARTLRLPRSAKRAT